MSTILDTFTAADGTLDGHTPDTTPGSEAWSTSAASETGGLLIVGNAVMGDGTGAPATIDSTGSGTLTLDTPVPTATLTLDFNLRTGATIDGATDFSALTLVATVNNVSFSADIYYRASDSKWIARCDGFVDSLLAVDITAGITANTTYAGTWTIENGAQSLDFAGFTAEEDTAFGGVDGFVDLYLAVGGFCKLLDMDVECDGPATGDADLDAPMAEFVGTGHNTVGENALDATAPMATIEALGAGSAHMAAPMMVLVANGHNATGENDLTATFPMPTLAAYGAGNASLVFPKPTLEITGTTVGWGQADMQAPMAQVLAAGQGATTGRADMRAAMATMVGYGGGILEITVGGATIEASGTMGSVGRAALRMPLFEMEAAGSRPNSGSAVLVAPMPVMTPSGRALMTAPMATLTAIGSAVVTVAWEAYAVNLNHNAPNIPNEVTRYTNYPFTAIVRWRGSYYGVGPLGLYLLEGTTDYNPDVPAKPKAIAWNWRTAITDFGTPAHKSVLQAWLAGSLGTKGMTATLYVGRDDETHGYPYPSGQDADVQNYRVKPGKGVRHHTYYALGAAGTGVLDLHSVRAELAELNRRLGKSSN